MYDFDSEEFQSAGVFNVKGLPDLYYMATMKDKIAILTNIDDDMIRDANFCCWKISIREIYNIERVDRKK